MMDDPRRLAMAFVRVPFRAGAPVSYSVLVLGGLVLRYCSCAATAVTAPTMAPIMIP